MRKNFFVLLVIFLLLPCMVEGEDNQPQGPIILNQANRVFLDDKSGNLRARGNVQITWGKQKLAAPRIDYSTKTGDLIARGGAKLTREGGEKIQGENIQWNRLTGEARVNEASGQLEPWFLDAPLVEGNMDTSFRMYSGSLTTCNLKTPHYYFQASKFYFYPGDSLIGYNVVFWVSGVPVFYLPWVMIDLKHRFSRWEVHPGYDSEEGFTLELNYHYLLPRDDPPFTGTIYTDWRENEGNGQGFDVDYDKKNKEAYFYYFQSERRPLVINKAGEEVRSETEDLVWQIQSHVDYEFTDSNWRFHSAIDWLSYSRFNRDFGRSLSSRTETERWIKSSFIHSSSSSQFRVDLRQEEKIPGDGTGNEFVRSRAFMPRVNYQLFSQPLPWGDLYYGFNTKFQRQYELDSDRWLWSGRGENSLNKSLYFNRLFQQSYRLTYGQNYGEEVQGDHEISESHGYFGFTLRNTLNFTRQFGADLNYLLTQRVNDKEEVTVEIGGEQLGIEKHGRELERIDLNWYWRDDKSYLNLRGGYDLRETINNSVRSDSRFLPLRLNANFEITDYWRWSHYLRYSVAQGVFDQSNLDWQFPVGSNFQFGLGWNYNRQSGEDLSKLNNNFDWQTTSESWRLRGDLIYNLQTRELDEVKFLMKRNLHCWDMRFMYREILDRERQFWIMFTLTDYPSRGLGFQQDIEHSSIDFESGNWNKLND